jgi:hypothetical protein
MLDRNLKYQHNFVSILQDCVDIEYWFYAIREEFFDVPLSIPNWFCLRFESYMMILWCISMARFLFFFEPVWEGEKLLDLMVEP